MVVRSGALVGILVWLGFADLAPGQALPFYDGFEDGDDAGWNVVDDPEPQSGPSQWVVENGALAQKSNIWSYGPVELETKYHLGTHITTGDKNWEDYTFNAIVRSTDNDGIGLIFRYQDPKNYYRILLMNDPAWSGRDSSGVPVNTPLQRLQKFVDGEPYILAERKVSRAFPSGWFTLTADARGDTLRAYLNGTLLFAALDGTWPDGKIGMLSYANAGAFYDSVSVTEERLIYSDVTRPITYPVREDRRPYIQNPTKTGVEIAWRSLQPALGSVLFGESKGELNREVRESAPTQKHHIALTDLEPSRQYYYSVYNGDALVQDEETFRTARRDDETEFSFLVLGDSGVNTESQWRVSKEMRRSMNQAEVDFVVHVGDVHQGVGDYYDTIYFKPYREIIKNVNVFTSIGNHDTYTDNAAVYLDDFYLPRNNDENSERYYSFRWGNAYFIALDTNIDYKPGSPQHRFFMQALESQERKGATWTFVYAHHPPWTEYWTNYYGDYGVEQNLVPLFEEYEVDMVMNGHTHSYERGEKNHVHYLVSGGGGGALDEYFVDYDHVTFSAGVFHFTRIDVQGDQLRVTAVDEFGGQVDQFLVNKRVNVGFQNEAMMRPPDRFELGAVFPNPAADRVTFTYRLAEAARVEVGLFDIAGREVDRLIERTQIPDTYEVSYDASHLPAGLYLIRLTAGDRVETRGLTIVR